MNQIWPVDIQEKKRMEFTIDFPIHTYILCIDTATEICSVALSDGAHILAFRSSQEGKSHALTLLPYIEEVIKEANITAKQLQAVALSSGPGSYTGLRIGTSTAKGLCYALEIPLISVPTPQIIAAGARKNFPNASLFCPLIDARRMEVFTALYNNELIAQSEITSQIVNEEFILQFKEQSPVFCGNAVDKSIPILSKLPNAQYDHTPLSACNMCALAFDKLQQHDYQDIAYFEPFYGKEYIAKKPSVKGLQ